MTPETQPPQLPGLAIQIVINGDKTSINFTPQSVADGGPVRTVGAHVSAAGHQAVQAGPDAAAARGEDQPSKMGWWARVRERGIVVTVAIIVTAIAAVIGTAVAICAWIGWTP